MLPLYQDPCFTFRFADDRLIPRFHLEGVEAGRRVSVFKIDPGTGERLGLLATATVGDGGWVDLAEPIIVRAGDAFIAVPEPAREAVMAGGLFRFRAHAGNPRSISPADCRWASASLRQRSQMIRPSTSDECSSQAGLRHTSHSR